MVGASRARARVRRSVVVLAALAATSTFDVGAVTLAPDECATVPLTDADWPMQNHDLAGTRANPAETTFSTGNVAGVQERWRFDTPPGTQVYGTPAIAGGCVYAADSLGNVYSLSAADGSLNWVNHIGPVAPWINIVTASVTVSQDKVFVGDQGGTVHALDRATGDLVWSQKPNAYGIPAIYAPGVLATVDLAGVPTEVLLMPIASNEETATPTDVQPCCTSRGSLAALDPDTGAVIWQSYMVNDEEYAAGASGASIWTVPAFDAETNTIYVATGNNFGNDDTAMTTETGDAIVAIDAADGTIRWANQRWADDSWVLHYSLTEADPAHPDYDFGDGAALFELPGHRKVVAAGQKSGFMHLLDAATGEVLDQEQFMPGGGLGGFMADSAVADRVVFGNGNDWPHQIPFGGAPANKGVLVAIEVTGSFRGAQLRELWRYESAANTVMMGGPAVVNGVVFVHSSGEGKVLAFDAAGDGTPLASVDVPAGISSIAVAHGLVVAGVGDNTTIAASDAPGAIVALGL